MNENMPNKATLVEVFKVNTKDLHPRFIEYDTHYFDKEKNNWAYYKLPEGEVLILLSNILGYSCENLICFIVLTSIDYI